jgi:hypothetical protein
MKETRWKSAQQLVLVCKGVQLPAPQPDSTQGCLLGSLLSKVSGNPIAIATSLPDFFLFFSPLLEKYSHLDLWTFYFRF